MNRCMKCNGTMDSGLRCVRCGWSPNDMDELTMESPEIGSREPIYRDPMEKPIDPNAYTTMQAVHILNWLSGKIHKQNKNWWIDLDTGIAKTRNKGEQLMLVVTEIAEAMEGFRKDLMDDHLPHRKMEEVELADAVIRIFDYAWGHGFDIGGALMEKLDYNLHRADHKIENRKKEGGKKV